MFSTVHFDLAYRATVTDLGRYAFADYGIPTNGAADQYAARAANILVGNADDAALVEVVASDLTFTAKAPLLIAVTGASATVKVNGIHCVQWEPILLPEGSSVSISGISGGLYTYLAIRGALIAERFRGSYAPDPLLGVGTQIASGTTLHIDSDFVGINHPHLPLFRFAPPIPVHGSTRMLDIIEGPEFNEFIDAGETLTRSTFHVGAQSNQVGTRLSGPRPARTTDTEILSRGVPLGAVEVPPAGDIIVLQRGRPVTAGYPVVAVVARCARDSLGQLRPGDAVRLRLTTADAAITQYRLQRQALDDLRSRVQTAYTNCGIGRTVTAVQRNPQPLSPCTHIA